MTFPFAHLWRSSKPWWQRSQAVAKQHIHRLLPGCFANRPQCIHGNVVRQVLPRGMGHGQPLLLAGCSNCGWAHVVNVVDMRDKINMSTVSMVDSPHLNRLMLNFSLNGGFNHFEKYEFVSWDDDVPNIWKYKSCSKPPTRMGLGFNLSIKLNLVTNWGYHIWHIERETNLIWSTVCLKMMYTPQMAFFKEIPSSKLT